MAVDAYIIVVPIVLVVLACVCLWGVLRCCCESCQPAGRTTTVIVTAPRPYELLPYAPPAAYWPPPCAPPPLASATV